MRRWMSGLLAGALLLGCSGGSTPPKSASTTIPESLVNDGTTTANQVIDKLAKEGLPIGPRAPHPSNDTVFEDLDGLIGKVDFKDTRLLSTGSDIDEGVDGGSVEVYRDERAAVVAAKDRGGYVFLRGPVLLHLSGDLAAEWVIAYRDALPGAAP